METIKARLKMLVAQILLVLMAAVFIANPGHIVMAEKPSQHAYSNTHTWEVEVYDTTTLVQTHIDSLVGTGLDYIFHFSELGPYSSLDGWIYVEVLSYDTGASASDKVDLTKDSMVYTIYTYSDQDPSIRYVCEIDSVIKAASMDTVRFSIPSDSGILTDVYFMFTSAIADSLPAHYGLGVTYRATVSMIAKP